MLLTVWWQKEVQSINGLAIFSVVGGSKHRVLERIKTTGHLYQITGEPTYLTTHYSLLDFELIILNVVKGRCAHDTWRSAITHIVCT